MVLDQIFLNWCYPKFIPYIIISNLISPCVAAYPTQHSHFSYIHLLDVLSFCSPALCVIKNIRYLPYSLFEPFLSQRILDTYLHFTHPTLILWLTSSSIPLSFCNIDLKYQNISFMCTTCPSKLTSSSSELSSLNWHLIYSVLVLLSQKPFDSKVYLHNSSFQSTPIPLSSINTTSSAKSMHQRMPLCIVIYHLWSHPSLRWKYINTMPTLDVILS
jgi:hypothetical protein